MGQQQMVPQEVARLPANRSLRPNVYIEYCNSWGYIGVANYASQLIKTVYPGAMVSLRSPGNTNNVVTYVNNVPVWNMQRDGSVQPNTATSYMLRIRKALEGYWWTADKAARRYRMKWLGDILLETQSPTVILW